MNRIKTMVAAIQDKSVKSLKPIRLWPFGILAYFILLLSIWFLVINETKTVTEILVKATLFALVAYGIYNLTNFVLFEKYDAKMVLFDTLYGVFVINVVSIATFMMSKYL